METANSTTKIKKSKFKVLLKYLVIGMVSFVVIAFTGNWIWTMSGSNQWKLEIDKDGTKVYSLKTPGTSIKKFKGVTHYKYSLNHIVAPFFDESIQENCAEWAEGCLDYKIIEPWNEKFQSNLQLWKFKLFPPFAPRETLLQGHLYQDNQTKEVFIENIAVPNTIPPNDGYVRVTHMHNIWHYTPQQNGEVRVEFTLDSDMGGAFPALLLNLGGAGQVHKMLHHDVPGSLDKEKYKVAKFDFIEEVTAKNK